MKLKKITAFTLAETLVTLVIIGVIAAMTIPALKKNADQRELAAKLKKAFSTMSQATVLIEQDYGPPRRWDKSKLTDYYKEHLNVLKECPPEKGCYYDSNITLKNGGIDIAYGDSGLMLTDGVSIKISPGYGAIAGYGIDPAEYDKIVSTMHIDLNGPNKPNQWGTDVYLFLLIDGKGIVPSGTFSEDQCKNSYGCASYVLREGKIQD